MFKKIFISVFVTFFISQAGDFVEYDRALRLIPAYTQEAGNLKGAAFSFNYVQQIGKTVFDFSLTPKYFYWSEKSNYSNGNTTLSFKDTSFVNPDYSFSSQKKISLEAAVLFSHRPSIRVREGAGALTFNFWRYGASFEWNIYKKHREEVDGWVQEYVINKKYLNSYLGLAYKPSMGVQITDRINLSVELMYTWCLELNDLPWILPKFGSGLSFTFSNPVKSF